VDHKVSVSGVDGEGGYASSRIAAGNLAGIEDDDTCWGDQSGSCAYADLDSTERVGIESGAVLEREEFSQIDVRVCEFEEAILGTTFVGQGLLGSIERECDR
jgi:hypothetical protein